jgi:hypothetical protein
MAIASWLENLAPDALAKFHTLIRKAQPAASLRVQPETPVRNAGYEAAFQGAVKMTTFQADQAWRAWVTAQK